MRPKHELPANNSGDFATPAFPGPGVQLGRYQIEALIGRGGMGAVYRALDPESGRIVALKTILQGRGGIDASLRFEREAQALARIRHRNVVGIRELFLAQGQLCMAMEFIEGESLQQYSGRVGPVSSGGMPLKEALGIMAAVAEALAFCHSKGLIHRDLKAANVLIEHESGRVVLVDFGLVRLTSGEDSEIELTQEGQVLGTLHSMPPEQLDPSYGPSSDRSDSWALGACLMKLLCGRQPYEGDDRLSLARAMHSGEARRLRDMWSDAPPWLDELCARSLRRDPKQRPSMASLAHALKNQEVPRERFRPTVLGALIVLLLGVLLLRSTVSLTPETRLELIGLPQTQQWTKDAHLELPFALSRPAIVQVRQSFSGSNKKKGQRLINAELRENAALRVPIALEPGLNEVEVRAQAGSELATKTIRIGLVEDEPRFEIQEPARPWRGAWVLGLGDKLRVQLDSTIPWALLGEFKAIEPSGRTFEFADFDEGLLSLEFKSPLGETIKKVVQILRVEDPARPWKAIEDLNSWNSASPLLRRRCAEAIDAAAPRLSFMRLERFRCAEQSAELAIYTLDGLGIEFVLVPGGRARLGVLDREAETAYCVTFGKKMGDGWDPKWGKDEPEDHEVQIKPFLIARRELVWRHWQTLGARIPPNVDRDDPATTKISEVLDTLRSPVARELKVRLPSDDEWEYSYRGGSTTRYFWGDDLDLEAHSIYFGSTTIAGKSALAKAPNAFGLFDMPWSVLEWTLVPQAGSKSEIYAMRGGQCIEKFQLMRACQRRLYTLESQKLAGLRLVIDAPELAESDD